MCSIGNIITRNCCVCDTQFEVIDPYQPSEVRCRQCQANWRIERANNMHATSKFIDYIHENNMARSGKEYW